MNDGCFSPTARDIEKWRPVDDKETGELVHEYSSLDDLFQHNNLPEDDEDREAIYQRRSAVWSKLEERVDLDYPDCPNCGETTWSQDMGDPVICNTCGEPGSGEVEEAVHEEWEKIWAYRAEAEDFTFLTEEEHERRRSDSDGSGKEENNGE